MKLLRDPLTHFLLGGALLFALYAALGEGQDAPDRVVVSETTVQMLSQTFERTRMRPPTPSELRGLVDDFVTEEILYRQALELGLDQNDLVIRRRLRQKMEFLTEDLALVEPADDEALGAYLAEHAADYEEPPTVSFRQVYLDPSRHADALETHAASVLVQLEQGAPDPRALGDATLLPASLDRAAPRDVSRHFGPALAEALEEAPIGRWSGPHPSSFGLHFVYVASREPARQPALAEVRAEVERDWSSERKRLANARFVEALRERFDIVIELPERPDTPPVATGP